MELDMNIWWNRNKHKKKKHPIINDRMTSFYIYIWGWFHLDYIFFLARYFFLDFNKKEGQAKFDGVA